MTALSHDTPPRVPVVLPRLKVEVDDRGLLQVSIDGEPYDYSDGGTPPGRDALAGIVDHITRRLGPVRIEVTEIDGTVYTDIATAPAFDQGQPEEEAPAARPGELAGAGFVPEEEVAVAVIVAHQPAGADGTAGLRLPPTLLASHAGRLLLIGRTSGTVAWGDAPGGRA